MNKMNISPVVIGQKVVVLGSEYVESFRPIVLDIVWLPDEYRFQILLFWSSGEESKVYSTDINKTWMIEEEYIKEKYSIN